MVMASKHICPICKDTCHHPDWIGLCMEEVISTLTLQPALEGAQEERPPRPPGPTVVRMLPWNLYMCFAGGLHPSSWGFIFRKHPDLLQPLQPWLHWELTGMLGQECSEALRLEDTILSMLPNLGLHEDHLIYMLQIHLQSHTTVFVQRLIGFTVEQCRRAAQRFLFPGDSQAAMDSEESPRDISCSEIFRRWQDRSPVVCLRWVAYQEAGKDDLMETSSPADSPQASPVPQPAPSSSTAAWDTDQLLSPLATALQECLGCPSPIPTPTPGQQGEPSKELGEAAGDASAPGQGSACSCLAPQLPVPSLVGGLHPCAWGVFFRLRPDLLQQLQLWLSRKLNHIFGEGHSQVLVLKNLILGALPVLGLHEERLIEELQTHLQCQTRTFVTRLIRYIIRHFQKKAFKLLLRVASQAGRDLEESPGEVICSALFRRWQNCSPAATAAQAAQQEPQEAAGDASAPGQGRACSCLAHQRPVKRKATGSKGSGTPTKKPSSDGEKCPDSWQDLALASGGATH